MPITDEQLKHIIEAAIMASGEALSIDKMLTLFVEEKEPPTRDAVKEAIKAIEAECETRGVELKKVSSGYRFQAKKDFAPWVSRLWEEKPARYSRALLETLVLIAYKQPLTRGEIEHVRGVAVSTNIIKTLLEREWVRVVGHRDVPGKPALYATTRAFLDYFNLKSLEELPTLAEIRDLDKINAELDLQEPGVDHAETGEEGEEGVGTEEVAQAESGDAIAQGEAGEEGVGQPAEEQSAEAQSEESLSPEASIEAAAEEPIEEVSDEDIDSNQDDRDDVMLDEHDKEMVSRLTAEEEELVAATESAENEIIVTESTNEIDEVTETKKEKAALSVSHEEEQSQLSVEDESKEESTDTVVTVEEGGSEFSSDEEFDSKFAS